MHNPQSKVACSPFLLKWVRANDLQPNRLKTNLPIYRNLKNVWRHCMLLCRCRWIRVRERTSNMADFWEFMTTLLYDVEIVWSRAQQKTSNMADFLKVMTSLCVMMSKTFELDRRNILSRENSKSGWLKTKLLQRLWLTDGPYGSISAAKMVRWSHSHVVMVTLDSLGTSLQPLVFHIADSPGRQNTHFPCKVRFEEVFALKL